LTACFASGRVAGQGALSYLKLKNAATDRTQTAARPSA
jgi:hypothetical protein